MSLSTEMKEGIVQVNQLTNVRELIEKWAGRVEEMEKKLLIEGERRYNDVMAAKKSGYEEGQIQIRQTLTKIGVIVNDPELHDMPLNVSKALTKIGELTKEE